MAAPSTVGNGASGPAMGGPATATGSGQDFILFDDWSSNGQQQQTPGAGPGTNIGRSSAFLDHRGTGIVAGAGAGAAESRGGQGGVAGAAGGESPFSSPSSRPDDDFSLNHPPNSGTLASSTAAPNRKRARGHGYSSSYSGPGGELVMGSVCRGDLRWLNANERRRLEWESIQLLRFLTGLRRGAIAVRLCAYIPLFHGVQSELQLHRENGRSLIRKNLNSKICTLFVH